VPHTGWLQAVLRWNAEALGYDRELAGDVVLVSPLHGDFLASPWQQDQVEVSMAAETGEYGVLVMSYTGVTLPFRLEVGLLPE
jgi:hypothetical protein